MYRILLTAAFLVFIISCKQAKQSTLEKEKMSEQSLDTSPDKRIEEVMDSILSFKAIKLNINEEHSDVDALIPVGQNNHGSFAFIQEENGGGASSMLFKILPAYDGFKMELRFDMDEEIDSILPKTKELIYYGLKRGNIKLDNSIEKITEDSLKKKYGLKFNVKKTFGPGDPDYDVNKKLLSSVQIRYHRGIDSTYPGSIIDSKFSMKHGVYDVYISDYFIIPWAEGVSAYVVLVTESLGFEGYIRKSIELISLGVITG